MAFEEMVQGVCWLPKRFDKAEAAVNNLFGSFTDQRDGQSYKTVKIGNKIWLAENLKYRMMPETCSEYIEEGFSFKKHIRQSKTVEYCFAPDDNKNNICKYGYLYTWDGAQKACPDGWHLPTKEDFEELLSQNSHSDKYSCLRATEWAMSSNASGFGALPAGYRWSLGEFLDFGSYADIWSATPCGKDDAYGLYIYSDDAYVGVYGRKYAFSVRCIQDERRGL